MPLMPPVACRRCGKATIDGSVCVGCRTPQVHDDYQERARLEPWLPWYHRKPWTGPHGIRAWVLTKFPICCVCKRYASTVADHIIPHKGVWKLFVDPKNLQGLCKECHDEKTGRESAEARSKLKG